MGNSGRNFIIFIAISGLVLGGIMLSGPPAQTNEENSAQSKEIAEEIVIDESLIYREDAPIIGNKKAKVKIIFFTDYTCSACKYFDKVIKELYEAHKQDLSITVRSFIIHPGSEIMTQAAEAAYRQGKFNEADSILYEEFNNPDEGTMLEMAKSIGLDLDKFKGDLQSNEIKEKIKKDNKDAAALNLRGTPSIFINGKQLKDNRELERVINNELAVN